MQAPKPDISELWIQHQRSNNKTTRTWACIWCPDRRIFTTEPDLWLHAINGHAEQLKAHDDNLEELRAVFCAESALKKYVALSLSSFPLPTAPGCIFACLSPRGSTLLSPH
jgi:hypothetical protein